MSLIARLKDGNHFTRNTHAVFAQLSDLEVALAERCVLLTEQPERIRKLTLYRWWPGGVDQTTSD